MSLAEDALRSAAHLHHQGDYAGSLKIAQQLLGQGENGAALLHQAALSLQHLGRLDEARQYCIQAIQLQTGYGGVYPTLLEIFNQQQRFQSSIAYATQLQQRNPQRDKLLQQIKPHFHHARQSLAIQQHVPVSYRDSNSAQRPIFIVSSVMRSGSTLVQRLCNSARQALVYGENWHLVNGLPESVWFAAREHGVYGQSHRQNQRRLHEIGEDFFTYNLFPDTEAYLKLIMRNFYRVIEFYAHSAQQRGFSCWGMKDPRSAECLHVLRLLIPHGRFIFLYRNILDAARSFKARGHYQRLPELRKVVLQWRNSLKKIQQLDAKNILLLKYEDLVANPQQEIQRLEAFTGLMGIQHAVMARKINLHDKAGSGCNYLEPKALSREEHALIIKLSGALLQSQGYDTAWRE